MPGQQAWRLGETSAPMREWLIALGLLIAIFLLQLGVIVVVVQVVKWAWSL